MFCNGKNVPLVAFKVIMSSKVGSRSWPGKAGEIQQVNLKHDQRKYARDVLISRGLDLPTASRLKVRTERAVIRTLGKRIAKVTREERNECSLLGLCLLAKASIYL
jgi:hypothetical protein